MAGRSLYVPRMTIFEKIIAREIPANVVYEDELCICFHDISPHAPIHLLMVPKKCIVRVGEADAEDKETLGHLLLMVQEVARQEGFLDAGFRVVINNGNGGGEEVPHLHLHILGGKKLAGPLA
jgi:histidine triad (HIT) family protein